MLVEAVLAGSITKRLDIKYRNEDNVILSLVSTGDTIKRPAGGRQALQEARTLYGAMNYGSAPIITPLATPSADWPTWPLTIYVGRKWKVRGSLDCSSAGCIILLKCISCRFLHYQQNYASSQDQGLAQTWQIDWTFLIWITLFFLYNKCPYCWTCCDCGIQNVGEFN